MKDHIILVRDLVSALEDRDGGPSARALTEARRLEGWWLMDHDGVLRVHGFAPPPEFEDGLETIGIIVSEPVYLYDPENRAIRTAQGWEILGEGLDEHQGLEERALQNRERFPEARVVDIPHAQEVISAYVDLAHGIMQAFEANRDVIEAAGHNPDFVSLVISSNGTFSREDAYRTAMALAAIDRGVTDEELAAAPVLEEWWFGATSRSVVGVGVARGHPSLGDGDQITTSEVLGYFPEKNCFRTISRWYRLGTSLENTPGAKRRWEAALNDPRLQYVPHGRVTELVRENALKVQGLTAKAAFL